MLTRWPASVMSRTGPFGSVWREMNRLQEELSQLLGPLGLDGRGRPAAGGFPALNLWEDESSVYVEAELPGLTFEEIEIYVTGGDQLTIKGERKEPQAKDGVWHRQERGFGSFNRTITLPMPVEADKVEAQLQHGVLTVRLPKGETAKPRKITVKGE